MIEDLIQFCSDIAGYSISNLCQDQEYKMKKLKNWKIKLVMTIRRVKSIYFVSWWAIRETFTFLFTLHFSCPITNLNYVRLQLYIKPISCCQFRGSIYKANRNFDHFSNNQFTATLPPLQLRCSFDEMPEALLQQAAEVNYQLTLTSPYQCGNPVGLY